MQQLFAIRKRLIFMQARQSLRMDRYACARHWYLVQEMENPAAFAQVNTKNMASVMQALSAVLDAASFPSQDQTKLVALAQSQQTDQSDDLELAAPAAATYTTHSGGIIDVLEDMKEKAEAQLSELRKAEVNNRAKAWGGRGLPVCHRFQKSMTEL